MASYKRRVKELEEGLDAIKYLASEIDQNRLSSIKGVDDILKICNALWNNGKGGTLAMARVTKTVRNLMTGQEVEIPLETPYCCDPSTETYWSM